MFDETSLPAAYFLSASNAAHAAFTGLFSLRRVHRRTRCFGSLHVALVPMFLSHRSGIHPVVRAARFIQPTWINRVFPSTAILPKAGPVAGNDPRSLARLPGQNQLRRRFSPRQSWLRRQDGRKDRSMKREKRESANQMNRMPNDEAAFAQ
jgi:hypothetical protein